MEEITNKIIENQIIDLNRIEEEGILKEQSLKDLEVQKTSKNVVDLRKEEEILTFQLKKLKKENFSLQTSITAWQFTLRKKLDELNKADSELNELYNTIWSGREEFCSKAEKFNDELGILSDWWKTQMKYVTDLEDLGKKREEEKKHQQEIEKLEKEVEELKKEIQNLEDQEEQARLGQKGDSTEFRCESAMLVSSEEDKIILEHQAEVHLAGDEEPRKKEKETAEISSDNNLLESSKGKKKVRFSDYEIQSCHEEIPCPKNDLFSMLNVEKVRRANRGRNRGNHLYGKVKKLLAQKPFK